MVLRITDPPVNPREVQRIAVGDTLADIPLLASGKDKTSLHDALGGSCSVIAVFHSSCGWCRAVAPRWTGIMEVEGVPVIWVSHPDRRDQARTFVAACGLGGKWFLVRKNKDLARLGVLATPRFLLADSSHVVQGFLDRNDPTLPGEARCG